MWHLLLYFMYCGGAGQQASSSTSNQIGFELVTSRREKPVLLRAGHRYNKRRTNKDNSTKWLCVKRDTCKAVLLITSNNLIIKDDRHHCEPDFVANELELEFDKCIQRVTTDYTVPITNAVRETISEITDRGLSLVQKLPNRKNIERKLCRKRNNSLGVSRVCSDSVMDIVVPLRFENFLLADYCHDSTRILIFAGDYCKDILKKPNLTVFCDGTFKFCLNPFKQMYTLHVDLGSSDTHSNVIPVLYALLPSKTQNVYETLFNLIQCQIPEFQTETFIVDFEIAAISAITNVFPKVNIKGCYFHFTRSLWRKVEQLGKNISKSKFVKKHIKRCSVLALLPKEVMDDAWLYIMSQCPDNNELSKFNDYFVDTWLNESSPFGDMWCVYNSPHRTTNSVESWHAIINKKNNKTPNSIAHFLTLLEKEDMYQQALYLKGSDITKKTYATIEFDDHLKSTLNQFMNGEISIELCIERLIV